MRSAAWNEDEIIQQAVGQLPWGHNVILLDKFETREERLAYANLAIKNGWSRNVMAHHIELKTAMRIGHAQTNFASTLPPDDSDLICPAFFCACSICKTVIKIIDK